MLREVAWRVFAGEYNDAVKELGNGGERAPTYVLSPLGAKINRLFLVGVLTDVENAGTDLQPMWRARVSDPTGIFHMYAGQYQPEASAALARIKPPAFVAVVGKSRTYSPDPATTYVSIRPEAVKTVDASLRDYWILEAARSLKRRLEAAREAYRMEPVAKDKLVALGYKAPVAEAIELAVQLYGRVDLARYGAMLAESLRYLLPEFRGDEPAAPTPEEAAEETPAAGGPTPAKAMEDAREDQVLDIVGQLDADGKGATWDAILASSKSAGIGKDALEELINGLLDKGLIYEPILGRMKRI